MAKSRTQKLEKLEENILEYLDIFTKKERRGGFVEDIVRGLYNCNELPYRDIPRSFKVSVRRAIHSLNKKGLLWYGYKSKSKYDSIRRLIYLPAGWYYEDKYLKVGGKKVEEKILELLTEAMERSENEKDVEWEKRSYVSKEYLALKKEGNISIQPGYVPYNWLIKRVAYRINRSISYSADSWAKVAISRAIQRLLDKEFIIGYYLPIKTMVEPSVRKRKSKNFMIRIA